VVDDAEVVVADLVEVLMVVEVVGAEPHPWSPGQRAFLQSKLVVDEEVTLLVVVVGFAEVVVMTAVVVDTGTGVGGMTIVMTVLLISIYVTVWQWSQGLLGVQTHPLLG